VKCGGIVGKLFEMRIWFIDWDEVFGVGVYKVICFRWQGVDLG